MIVSDVAVATVAPGHAAGGTVPNIGQLIGAGVAVAAGPFAELGGIPTARGVEGCAVIGGGQNFVMLVHIT